MKKIISLSSGCSATYPSVIPKNWKTAGKDSLLKDWTIYCYFEDPLHKKQYPKGKRIRTKGMNEFKTLGERREATEILLQGIVGKLEYKVFFYIKKPSSIKQITTPKCSLLNTTRVLFTEAYK